MILTSIPVHIIYLARAHILSPWAFVQGSIFVVARFQTQLPTPVFYKNDPDVFLVKRRAGDALLYDIVAHGGRRHMFKHLTNPLKWRFDKPFQSHATAFVIQRPPMIYKIVISEAR